MENIYPFVRISDDSAIMDWIARITFSVIIVWILPSLHAEDAKLIEYDVTARRCYQNFRERIAYCDNRNLKNVPRYLNHDVFILILAWKEMKSTISTIVLSANTLFLRIYIYEFNDITYIETGTFYPLKHLRVLYMRYNRNIYILNSLIFRWSTQLAILNLRSCGLQSFPNDTFRWLPRLEELYLELQSYQCHQYHALSERRKTEFYNTGW